MKKRSKKSSKKVSKKKPVKKVAKKAVVKKAPAKTSRRKKVKLSDLQKKIIAVVNEARSAAAKLSSVPTKVKNEALKAMADGLVKNSAQILSANARDMIAAKAKRQPKALQDRLLLNKQRIQAMAQGLRELSRLPDPVGEKLKQWTLENGLQITKERVPIGVIAIIYEARPNVTADCAGLCLKAGNAVVLRGGSEALHANKVIAGILQEAATKAKIPAGAIGFISLTDHKAVDELVSLTGSIDLVIPRGGEGLIRTIVEKAKVPVIKQYKGVCHTYVDQTANLSKARSICYNAKVQRPAVCNAMETMLVHKGIAHKFLPAMAAAFKSAGVELRVDRDALPFMKPVTAAVANEEDWPKEYLDLILAVKVVGSLDEAMEHIRQYGSGHSEAIVTQNKKNAERFLKEVDASTVYVNASTRFTDGGQFGLGAEIGISTDKLHARGPMGLEELTTYKYLVRGKGQIRT